MRSAIIGLVIFAAVIGAYVAAIARTGAPFKPAVAIVMLVLVVLAPSRFLTDASKIRKLRYMATDQRLMVVTEGGARSVTYGRIDQAAFKTDGDGMTSLLCGKMAVNAKENKRREIAVIGMVGGDRAEEGQPIESFGFYGLDKKDVGTLRSILNQRCPAIKIG